MKNNVKTITGPDYEIRVELFDEQVKKGASRCGCITSSNLHVKSGLPGASIDAIETLILEHACAGVNIEAEPYVKGVLETLAALRQANEFSHLNVGGIMDEQPELAEEAEENV